jgi:hypothetical protein
MGGWGRGENKNTISLCSSAAGVGVGGMGEVPSQEY